VIIIWIVLIQGRKCEIIGWNSMFNRGELIAVRTRLSNESWVVGVRLGLRRRRTGDVRWRCVVGCCSRPLLRRSSFILKPGIHSFSFPIQKQPLASRSDGRPLDHLTSQGVQPKLIVVQVEDVHPAQITRSRQLTAQGNGDAWAFSVAVAFRLRHLGAVGGS